jgi:glyoxylase-like metal-dependent hydrolase (beta-lactamase superfamily II)
MSADSVHFRLEEVAVGAWAVLAGTTGACASNAGIIDLGDRTVIFDTFMTPEAGRDLRAAAEKVTGRRGALVVNSHHHGDHVLGNQAFADADIVSTARTIELIAETSPSDLAAHADRLRDGIGKLDGEIINSPAEPVVPRDIEQSRGVARMPSARPVLSITLPTRTYEDELVVEGSERSAHILTYGGGHTDSDTFVFLPDVSLIFAGDLLSVEDHPWAGDGNPDEWINIIYRMEALSPGTVVPGHGAVTTFEYAHIFTRYLTFICDMVKQARATSTPVVKLAETPIPPQYAQWGSAGRYRQTLETLGRRAGLPLD